jgi:hypothetical protein
MSKSPGWISPRKYRYRADAMVARELKKAQSDEREPGRKDAFREGV